MFSELKDRDIIRKNDENFGFLESFRGKEERYLLMRNGVRGKYFFIRLYPPLQTQSNGAIT